MGQAERLQNSFPSFVRGVQYKVEVSLLQLARKDLYERGKLIQSHVCLR